MRFGGIFLLFIISSGLFASQEYAFLSEDDEAYKEVLFDKYALALVKITTSDRSHLFLQQQPLAAAGGLIATMIAGDGLHEIPLKFSCDVLVKVFRLAVDHQYDRLPALSPLYTSWVIEILETLDFLQYEKAITDFLEAERLQINDQETFEKYLNAYIRLDAVRGNEVITRILADYVGKTNKPFVQVFGESLSRYSSQLVSAYQALQASIKDKRQTPPEIVVPETGARFVYHGQVRLAQDRFTAQLYELPSRGFWTGPLLDANTLTPIRFAPGDALMVATALRGAILSLDSIEDLITRRISREGSIWGPNFGHSRTQFALVFGEPVPFFYRRSRINGTISWDKLVCLEDLSPSHAAVRLYFPERPDPNFLNSVDLSDLFCLKPEIIHDARSQASVPQSSMIILKDKDLRFDVYEKVKIAKQRIILDLYRLPDEIGGGFLSSSLRVAESGSALSWNSAKAKKLVDALDATFPTSAKMASLAETVNRRFIDVFGRDVGPFFVLDENADNTLIPKHIFNPWKLTKIIEDNAAFQPCRFCVSHEESSIGKKGKAGVRLYFSELPDFDALNDVDLEDVFSVKADDKVEEPTTAPAQASPPPLPTEPTKAKRRGTLRSILPKCFRS